MTTELRLRIGMYNGKSRVMESCFTSPLKIGTPRTEGERLTLVLMMASAGILKGDEFDYKIICEPGTKTLITEQSYTKIFDTGEGGAKRLQDIQVAEEASLYYRPCAAVPFSGSTYDGEIGVKLKEHSEFAYADIVTAGRIGMGEQFAFRHYKNRICVEIEGRPVFLDSCLLEPGKMDLSGMLFFDGYTHQGTFYYYGRKEKQEQILAYPPIVLTEGTLAYGATEAAQGIVVRILAKTAQDIEEIFAELADLLELT